MHAVKATTNPYRTAAGLVLGRLFWDLKPEARRSRLKLRGLRDSNAGKKAIICCNGPSLLKVDFSLLQGAYVFGLNKINLLFDKHAFRPSSIVAVNPLVIEQNAAFYRETDIPLFLDSAGLRHVESRASIAFLHSTAVPRFAQDCSISVYQGATVTFVAMQLAFHLGFSEVAIVGCDHDFVDKGPANMAVASGPRDQNHFDPHYFAGGMQWQLPDLPQSELSYHLAKRAYEAAGRRLVNCTDGGKLEVFERQSLGEFING